MSFTSSIEIRIERSWKNCCACVQALILKFSGKISSARSCKGVTLTPTLAYLALVINFSLSPPTHQPQNGTNTYNVIRGEKTTATKDLKTPMHLNGGVRKMQVEKRKREGRSETPSGGLWDEEEFVELYREMASMKPPRIPQKVNTDFGFKYKSVAELEAEAETESKSETDPESEPGSGSESAQGSMSGSVSGSVSGSSLKSEPGAGVVLPDTSEGSAIRPIDLALDDAEKKRAIAKAEYERWEYELRCAEAKEKLKAFNRGGTPNTHVASEPVSAAQSATAAAAPTVAPKSRSASFIGGGDDVSAGGAAGDQNGGAVGAPVSKKGVVKAPKKKYKTKVRMILWGVGLNLRGRHPR